MDLSYTDVQGRTPDSRIWPLGTAFLVRKVICPAFCCLRQDFRRFKVLQMAEVRLTDESFRPKRVALLRTCLVRLSEGGRSGTGA